MKKLILALVLIIVFVVLGISKSPAVPTCDDPRVLETANKALHNTPYSKALENTKLKIGDLEMPGEVEYDSNKDQRTCRAKVREANGTDTWLKYKVSWHDKKNGVMFVEFTH